MVGVPHLPTSSFLYDTALFSVQIMFWSFAEAESKEKYEIIILY